MIGGDIISAEEQLNHMIDTYQNLIFTICYKSTGNYFDAQDLTQDTFLSAYKNISHFDGKNEKAWLCRIATNKCLDYYKRACHKSIPTTEQYFLALQCDSPSPEDNYLTNEVKEQLHEYCTQLKSPYKEVALAYFYDEEPLNQIANNTGRNLKTIQTQMYRAKAMLQKLYHGR